MLGFSLAGNGDWFKFTFVFAGMHKMTPPIKDLLPRLTPILKNRHEKVQENCIDLVGRIADRWVDSCFVISKSGQVQRVDLFVCAFQGCWVCVSKRVDEDLFWAAGIAESPQKSHPQSYGQHFWLYRQSHWVSHFAVNYYLLKRIQYFLNSSF